MKRILIGIDVSKETIAVSVIFPEKTGFMPEVVYYDTFNNAKAGFRLMVAAVRKVSGKIKPEEWLFCCETTGAYDRALCDYLYGQGLDIWRENALRIRWSRGLIRGKNDKADSKMIAEYAWRHTEKVQLYVSPSPVITQLKALYKYREHLVTEKKAKMVRANEIKATAVNLPAIRFMYNDSMKEVERLEESIKECEKQIKQLIESDEDIKRNYDHITSIKGVKIVTATGLIVYSNNFKTLVTSRQASSYCGCANFFEDSGTSVHKKVDTRNLCNRRMKGVLTQAARSAIASIPEIGDYAARMTSRGKEWGIVLNNVRNKLLHIMYSLVQNDCDYEPDHERKRNLQLCAGSQQTSNLGATGKI